MLNDSDWLDKSQPIYRSLLSKFVCDSPAESCYSRSCRNCPKVESIRDILEELFNEHEVYEVTHKMWTTTNHCTLQNISYSTDDFLQSLCNQIDKKILRHDYAAKSQNRYLQSLKETLAEGEFIILMDFAENYAYVAQDAAQAFHFNNDQATLFPSVIYFRDNGELKHTSFVVISDCRHHDVVAVYRYQCKIIEFLKKKFAIVKKIYYYTDGAPQQFKNKSAFANLHHHEHDFGIEAEWHFFATAHGKGPCDGLAGTIKRLARRCALQRDSEHPILNCDQLYEWATSYFDGIEFNFVSKKEYDVIKKYLEPRFAQALPIKGSQGIHCVQTIQNKNDLMIKFVSSSTVHNRVKIIK